MVVPPGGQVTGFLRYGVMSDATTAADAMDANDSTGAVVPPRKPAKRRKTGRRDKVLGVDAWARQREITSEMKAHVDADETCLITIQTVLSLAQRAKDIFKSSKVTEKQQLLKFMVSNFSLNDGKLVLELKEPFSLFAKNSDQLEWRPTEVYFRTFDVNESRVWASHIFNDSFLRSQEQKAFLRA